MKILVQDQLERESMEDFPWPQTNSMTSFVLAMRFYQRGYTSYMHILKMIKKQHSLEKAQLVKDKQKKERTEFIEEEKQLQDIDMVLEEQVENTINDFGLAISGLFGLFFYDIVAWIIFLMTECVLASRRERNQMHKETL